MRESVKTARKRVRYEIYKLWSPQEPWDSSGDDKGWSLTRAKKVFAKKYVNNGGGPQEFVIVKITEEFLPYKAKKKMPRG